MLRKPHGSTEPQPLFGHGQPDLVSDVTVFSAYQGTSGDDFIKGSEGDDTIDGYAGNDQLKGQGGNDVIHGGDGNDYLLGGDGDDILYGESGNNEVHGGDGDDQIFAASGSYDTLYGGIGTNVITGGNKATVYTILDGVDRMTNVRYWYVDYSLSTANITVDNDGLHFSTGSAATSVYAYGYKLGSGNDLFTTTVLSDHYSTVDAGGGTDTFELNNTTRSYLPMSLSRTGDGVATLTILSSNGHDTLGVFTSFENFHIVSKSYSQTFRLDGSLLYSGIHVDLDFSATFAIDFTAYDGQVVAVAGDDTLTINGSTFHQTTGYTITLNDVGGIVTASGTLTGGVGDDTLTGLTSADRIYGGGGTDTLDGGVGNDYVYGGNGDDTIAGSAGDDHLYGEIGSDTIDGGDGIDTIDGGDGDNTITGGLGNDTIVVGLGLNFVDGGDGDDTITGGDGNDKLLGSAGNDRISGGLGHNNLNGGDGDDILTSAAGTVDTVNGGTGNDSWSGDDRAITANMIAAWDKTGLHVSDGIEVTKVETISFVLGSGDDHLSISVKPGGSLYFNGNTGTDTIDYSGLKGGITLSLAASGSQDTGGGGRETIYGFENVIGTAKADTLTGTTGDNQLTGGGGADTLTGGTGADTFLYAALTDLGRKSDIDKIDRITDFSHAEGDKIDLSAIDADKKTDGDQAFAFVGTDAFTVGGTGPGEIRFTQSVDGYLLVQGDTNHDGKADFSLLVHNTALVASDFVL